MREKTAEEKLREELEGKLSEAPHEKEIGNSEPMRMPVKPRAKRSRGSSRKTEKPVNIGQRVDSFMEDFERRIAETLNAEKVLGVQRSDDKGLAVELERVGATGSVEPAKKAGVRSVRRRRRNIDESAVVLEAEKTKRDVLGLGAIFEPTETETIAETAQPIHEQETMHEAALPIHEQETLPETVQPIHEQETLPENTLPIHEQDTLPENAQPIHEQETLPETVQPIHEQETLPETAQPIHEQETLPETALPIHEQETIPEAAQPMHESQDIPVEIVDEPEQDFNDDNFPDIPVIDAKGISESSANTEDNTFPDIPVIIPEPTENNDNFTAFSEIDDDIHDSFEELETPSTAPENNSDFPPFADVVVNVDAELPQINSSSLENSSDDSSAEQYDPENEAAPVTVTMPESTKTAEDKLMANIAEAMTGNPLTLDKPDPSEPYRLPENLLTPQNDPNFSPKSAEDKLIADISQAISESPIETAQNQANQNFEEDISPFDEMPLPEPIQTPDFDDTYEQNEQEEGDDFDEPFLPDFSDKTEQPNEKEDSVDEDLASVFDNNDTENTDEAADLSSIVDDVEHNTDNNSDLLGSLDDSDNTEEDFAEPFSIPDNEDDSDSVETPENTEDFSELPVAEDDTALDDDMSDFSGLPDISLLNEPEFDSEPVNFEDTTAQETEIESDIPSESEPAQEADTQPVTAEERLAQELADCQNQDTSNEQLDFSAQNVDPEPEQSLLDAPDTLQEQQTPDTSNDDTSEDFNFMASWGDAASTMNYGDDEQEPQEQKLESQEVFSPTTQPVAPAESAAKITHEPLTVHKPQTPQELFELPHPEVQKAAVSPLWNRLLQAVLGLLILAGLFSLFRLHQLTDSITGMMLYGNTSGVSAQSYDYAVDLIPDEEISSRMRLRGIEGWKVVGSRRTQDTTTGRYGYEFIFMRQKPGNL